MAPCNGATLNHSALQWHPAMEPSNGTTSTQPKLVVPLPPTMAHCNGTLQWHPAMAPRPLHPAMAPSNGTTSTQPYRTTMAPCNGTQHWHHVHSTIARYNGTLQWHPAMAPRPLNYSTLQWHPAMAPSNGTTSTAPCNGILVPRPMRKSGSSPSPPLLEVRTPIALAIWGKMMMNNSLIHSLMSGRFQSKSHNWWKCKHLQRLSTGSKLLLESPYAPQYIPGWVNHRCRVQSMKNALRLKK